MWPNLQETVDLITFTEETFNEEILNGKLCFSCSDWLSLLLSKIRLNRSL